VVDKENQMKKSGDYLPHINNPMNDAIKFKLPN